MECHTGQQYSRTDPISAKWIPSCVERGTQLRFRASVEELFQEAMTERKEYELAQLRSARMLSYNVTNTSQVHEHNQIS